MMISLGYAVQWIHGINISSSLHCQENTYNKLSIGRMTDGAKTREREKGREPRRRETDVYVVFLEGLLSIIRPRHHVLH